MLKRSNLRLFEKAVSFLNIIVISNKHLFEKVVAFPNIIIISKMVERQTMQLCTWRQGGYTKISFEKAVLFLNNFYCKTV